MIRFTRLLAAAAFAALTAHAQQPFVRGEPALAPPTAPPAQLRLAATAPKSIAILPPVSDAEIASVREANRRSSMKTQTRRVVVGVERSGAARAAFPLSPGGWSAVAGGHGARVAITSPGAGSMRLAIDLRGVPEDVEMVFFGSALPARLEGPIKVGEVRDRSTAWWSPLTEGATQTVEFFAPARIDPAALGLAVVAASHLFTTPSSRFTKRIAEIGDSGACNVDIACSPLNASAAFQNAVDAVAQMVFTDGSFTALCTGTLLADNDPATQTPYFFSANHCFDNDTQPYKTPSEMQQVANTLNTLWHFEANSCAGGVGSGIPDSSWSQLSGGSVYLYSDAQNDGLLVRLNNAPPGGSFYSGWDANAISVGTPVLTIHHPQGDLKKVSQGTVQTFSSPGVGGGLQSFISVLWGSGTTEPGSSGGGLWTSGTNGYLLRGGLWGGSALCTNRSGLDNFSRFDVIYPNVAQYLSSAVTPAADYTDLWWNPSESGWGLNLVQHPSTIIFGVWYTYEADGTRTWFVMPTGSWTSSTTYTGPLYVTNGPAFTKTFVAGQVQPRQVGSATLNFTGSGTGTFSYSVDGVSGTKSIQRQSY
jgi:lysyl endopeptidase